MTALTDDDYRAAAEALLEEDASSHVAYLWSISQAAGYIHETFPMIRDRDVLIDVARDLARADQPLIHGGRSSAAQALRYVHAPLTPFDDLSGPDYHRDYLRAARAALASEDVPRALALHVFGRLYELKADDIPAVTERFIETWRVLGESDIPDELLLELAGV